MGAAEIVAFLKALPALVKLLSEVFSWIKELSKEDPAQFMRDAHEVMSHLRQAKTAEEKSDAAKSIQDLIRRL